MPLADLLQSAAFAPLPNLGWLKVTGNDRTRWLNGMVTNNIADLTPGHANYNFVLSNQGRIQADLTAFPTESEDALLLQTDRTRLPALITLFDKFIIMDDVELADISETRTGLTLIGPAALRPLLDLGLTPLAVQPLETSTPRFQGEEILFFHAHSPLVPRFELWSDPNTIALLTEALEAARIPQATPEDLEHLRILEGTPLYGTDIRNSDTAKDLPQETAPLGAQSRALHFSKGCYLGQEIVERINSRGAVHRTFAGFLLTGELPPAGTPLTADGKSIGELTSVAPIDLPAGSIQMALGYIRREVIERGAPITYPGGTAIYIKLPAEHART